MSVTVYSDVDFKGKSATLSAGRHKLDPSMNDCVSSVRVPAGWKVTLYEHVDFNGQQITLEADTPKLEGALHDQASSLVITEPGQQHSESTYTNYFGPDNGDDWFYFEDSTTNS
ncbi:peptidase inhibitor family I36 protein [Streptomyces sp. NPDC052676]|uniref:peptidase inhibitor family I36 protein n=1 Tax=Streptomyces sp. NPDC052676 TaxID=3154953 RepID=UPI0034120115